MSALDGLRRLGFSENEAKVYLALLRHPGTNGYEVSRLAGVPRAKVYEVLEGLVQRGAILPEVREDRTIYRALSYTTLLQEHRRSTDALLTDLYRDLSRYSHVETGPSAVTVTGYQRAMTRVAEVVGAARQSVMAAGRPEELMLLGPHLAAAQRRGPAVQVLSRGPVRLAVDEIYVQPARKNEASLAVLADMTNLCLVDLSTENDAYAIITSAPGLAQVVGGWMRREIAIGEIERLVGERLHDLLPSATVQQMQRLWRS